jgi:hypothetical protein
MIKLKTKVMCILCCLLVFSGSNIVATLYECSSCDGGTGWIAITVGGEPPECSVSVSERELGMCCGPASPDETCYSNSRSTTHRTYYMLWPDIVCEAECAIKQVLCVAMCQLIICEDGVCQALYDLCVAACDDSTCEIIDTVYVDYQEGC